MSCNGCRVLRKGCSETCILRSCLHWIDTPEAQGHATLFLAKFFGRSDLLSFIAAVPDSQRPALFQSLLFEACGRTVNPVDGVVGLLSSGNWHVCEAAVETVLSGGSLKPNRDEVSSVDAAQSKPLMINKSNGGTGKRGRGRAHHHHHHHATSFYTEQSEMLMLNKRGNQEKKLLNLFV